MDSHSDSIKDMTDVLLPNCLCLWFISPVCDTPGELSLLPLGSLWGVFWWLILGSRAGACPVLLNTPWFLLGFPKSPKGAPALLPKDLQPPEPLALTWGCCHRPGHRHREPEPPAHTCACPHLCGHWSHLDLSSPWHICAFLPPGTHPAQTLRVPDLSACV